MKKVLVVDDSMVARKILIRSFPKEWEVEVAQASGGEAALSACLEAPPEVMFLDLNMPGLDGYGVLKALQGNALPAIIVVSADIQPLARERVFAMGARAFVKKPSTTAELEAALRTCGIL
jgi:two-component system, chemotaxis family, chemotaxis protein CheY